MTRILGIDDDPISRELIAIVLQTVGYEVVVVDSVESGVRAYGASPFDVVITDIVMEGTDGLQAIVYFKTFTPRPKILAISGGGQISGEDYLYMAETLEVNGTLLKPFSEQQLLDAVREVLRPSS